MNETQKRILVFGPTGVSKEEAISVLKPTILRESYGLPSDTQEKVSKNLLQVFELEEEIRQECRNELTAYFELNDRDLLHSIWARSLDRIIRRMTQTDNSIVFILLHAHYYWKGRQLAPISISKLREFKPTHSICLIDDIYTIWNRVVLRELQRQDGSYFRLKDIAWIRATELNISDLVTREICGPGKRSALRNNVISVRQSPSSLYRLLFQPSTLKAYASYPISKTRFQTRTREEIDNFRNKMHDSFMVFDPLCIDEKILQFCLVEYLWWNNKPSTYISGVVNIDKKTIDDFIRTNMAVWKEQGIQHRCDGEHLLLNETDRWPIEDNSSLTSPATGSPPFDYPVNLKVDEVMEVSSDIDKQIKERDFRLISQADTIAMYRPQYRGVGSDGVFAEYNFAVNALKMRVFPVFHEDEDGPPKEPFKAFPKVFADCDMDTAIDAMMAAMKVYEAEKQGKEV